jgi:hypothetical protein
VAASNERLSNSKFKNYTECGKGFPQKSIASDLKLFETFFWSLTDATNAGTSWSVFESKLFSDIHPLLPLSSS